MHIEKKTLKNIFLGVAACIILYWLLNETETVNNIFTKIYNVFSPFIFGAVLAFIFNVPMRGIERALHKVKNEKLRRVLAVTITLILVMLVVTLVLCLLIPELIETVRNLVPRLKEFAMIAQNKTEAVFADNPKIKDWVDQNGIVESLTGKLGDMLTKALASVVGAIGNITSVLTNIVITLVFSIYCLCQKETLSRQGRKILYALFPEKFSDEAIRIMRLTNAMFSNFLSGQCIEVCILGTMFAISMAIFRMPYIPLVSVLIAVTAFIPVVGAWAGCVCGTFLMFVADPVQAVVFLIMFVVLQQIENNIIYPRVVGTSIGLSGMWVLLAVAIGGELFGAIGMFLMIPIAAVIQTLLREIIAKKLHNKNIDPTKFVPQPPLSKKTMNEEFTAFSDDEISENASEGKTE